MTTTTKLIIMQEEAFNEIIQRLERLEKILSDKQKHSEDVLLDNADLLQALHISKRTAQHWRDSGLISFSQIGNKIFYRMKDIQAMLDKHQSKAFKK